MKQLRIVCWSLLAGFELGQGFIAPTMGLALCWFVGWSGATWMAYRALRERGGAKP